MINQHNPITSSGSGERSESQGGLYQDLQAPNAKLFPIVAVLSTTSPYYEQDYEWLPDLNAKWMSTIPISNIKVYAWAESGQLEAWPTKVIQTVNVDPLLSRSPKFKMGVDYFSKKFNSTTISIDLINSLYKGLRFSDWVGENTIIGKKVLVWWASQTLLNGSDIHAYPVVSGAGGANIEVVEDDMDINRYIDPLADGWKYTDDKSYFKYILQNCSHNIGALNIKEFKHSSKTATIFLQDKIKETLSEKVPSKELIPKGHLVPNTSAYHSQSRNKILPIVYGFKQKVPMIVDSDYNLRVDRYWDDAVVIGGSGTDDPTSIPQAAQTEGEGLQHIGEYLYTYANNAYTLIPMWGGNHTNSETPDDGSVVDMQGAKQYRYKAAENCWQLYTHIPAYGEEAVEDEILNADQYQQLSQGTYQALPKLEQTSIIQKVEDIAFNDYEYRELRTGPTGTYGVGTHGNEFLPSTVPLTDSYTDADLVQFDQWYASKKLTFSSSSDGVTNLPRFGVTATNYDVRETGAGQIGAVDPNIVTRTGYSVVIPVLSFDEAMSGTKLRFVLRIKNISEIEHTANAYTNANWISPASLSSNENYINVANGTEITDGGWLLKLMVRGVNVADFADYEGRDIIEGGQGWPEFEGHWAVRYMNINYGIPNYEGDGQNSDYADAQTEGIGDHMWSEYLSYQGQISQMLEFNLTRWEQKTWSGLEIVILPSHWLDGWKFDNVNFDSDDYQANPTNYFHFDTGAGNPPLSFSAGIDFDISNFEFTAVGLAQNVPSQQLFMDVWGRKNADGYITAPHYVVTDLYLAEILHLDWIDNADLTAPNIDVPSLISCNIFYGDWKLDFAITDSKRGSKIIESCLKDSPIVAIFNESGKLSFDYIKSQYSVADTDFDNKFIRNIDVLKSSFTQTRLEDVILNLNVHFDVDHGGKKHRKQTGPRTITDILSAPFNQFYGIDNEDQYTSVYYADTISDSLTAYRFRDYLLMWNCNQHTIINLTLTLRKLFLNVGDVIVLEDLSCLDGVKPYGEDPTWKYAQENGINYRNDQEIYPLFKITSVEKSDINIKISAVQLHNLSIEQNPYDFTGCTDPNAINYNEFALVDDGSCEYFINGCTDPEAINYNPDANIGDGSCIIPDALITTDGCTDPTALNYNPTATNDDGTCVYEGGNPAIYGSDDTFDDDDIHVYPYNNNANRQENGTGVPVYPFYNHTLEPVVGVDDLDYLSNIWQDEDLNILEHYVMDGNWDGVLDQDDIVGCSSYATLSWYTTEEEVYELVVLNYYGFRPDYFKSFSNGGEFWCTHGHNPTGIKTDERDIWDTGDVATAPFVTIPRGYGSSPHYYEVSMSLNGYNRFTLRDYIFFAVRCSIPFKHNLFIKNNSNNGWVDVLNLNSIWMDEQHSTFVIFDPIGGSVNNDNAWGSGQVWYEAYPYVKEMYGIVQGGTSSYYHDSLLWDVVSVQGNGLGSDDLSDGTSGEWHNTEYNDYTVLRMHLHFQTLFALKNNSQYLSYDGFALGVSKIVYVNYKLVLTDDDGGQITRYFKMGIDYSPSGGSYAGYPNWGQFMAIYEDYIDYEDIIPPL